MPRTAASPILTDRRYFWDGTGNLSDRFKLQRLLEYASFPDMLKIPWDLVVREIENIPVDKLRTSDNRKRFLRYLFPHIATSSSWIEAIRRMMFPGRVTISK
ncbi:MAG TPA: hypothetical protein PLV42_10155 [bacterium]|nr:hypothetical protein [bacterium]